MQDNIIKYSLHLLSKIPMSLAYKISDFLYFLQIHIIRYREGVIKDNLRRSFPDEPEEKITEYYKDFNRHLTDYAMESLTLSQMSEDYSKKHIYFENLDVLKNIYDRKQNLILLVGHIFNWEYTTELAKHLPSKNKYAVYRAINNKAINDYIKESRSKYHVSAITMRQSVKKMLSAEKNGESTFLLVADQSPYKGDIRYSLNFLNQETPVYHGFDQLIRKKDFAVVYIHVEKTARGTYYFKLEELKPKGDKWESHETIHTFFNALENNIKRDPSNWLWSHKRWKYKKGIHY